MFEGFNMQRVVLLLGLQSLWALALSLFVPDRVATHFGPSGVPDQWMSKGAFLGFMVFFPIGISLFMLLISRNLHRFGPNSLNVPNADYWRKPENFPTACLIMERWMERMCQWLIVFLGSMNGLIAFANRGSQVQLPMIPFFVLLGVFLLGVIKLVISLNATMRVG